MSPLHRPPVLAPSLLTPTHLSASPARRRPRSALASAWTTGALLACGALLASGALLVGCGSSEITDRPVEPDTLANSVLFCQAFAEAVCTDSVAQWCGGKSAKVAECKTTQTSYCQSRVAAARYVRATATVRAEDCLAAARGAYGKKSLTRDERANVVLFSEGVCAAIAGVESLVPGAAGEACDDAAPCAKGLSCIGSVCKATKVVDAGESCNGTTTLCASEYFCDEGLCVVRQAKGGRCTTNDGCQSTYNCVSGKCASKPGEGAACSDALPCGGTLRCDAGTCTAPIGSAEPCTEDADCTSGICSISGSGGVCLDELELTPLEPHCSTLR